MIDKLFFGALLLIAAMVLLMEFSVDRKRRHEWETFKTANECKVISKTDSVRLSGSSTGTSDQPVNAQTTTPSKTGWICKDGITYYK
ncbi:hypothetical protein HNP33_002036 [Comamonas odontotermitis]|uniref:DUF4124 domain-containing protein n=1 Tax=Comamonas odontotermitis TaxID=379895 RepID=A0ABR6RFN9_9BURK|nr:hypothetical protein [Comamonas odontotermitis]MBB6577968.1 hypothetical protein [Comamonas odontotermitis]